MLNGHEWVERQARRQTISASKEGNCFVGGSFHALDRLADTLCDEHAMPVTTYPNCAARRWSNASSEADVTASAPMAFILAGMLVLRERVLKPVLAGLGKPRVGRPPTHVHPIDQHYQALQQELRRTFETLGLAACP